MGKAAMVSISMTPELVEQVDRLAKADGRSRSNMVGKLLVEALEARDTKIQQEDAA